jgi:arylsulfatase A-like enzyme
MNQINKIFVKSTRFLLTMSITVLSLLISINCHSSTKKSHSKPNILFIAVDDLNDWIAPLGGLEICKTPNLDKLAAQSIVFENAHCASPACCPSRLSIMTGVQPSKSGTLNNLWYDGPQWRKEPIFKDIETIEQFFHNRGYETLAGGKIYHTLSPPWTMATQVEPEPWDFYFPSAYVNIPYQIRAKNEVIFPPEFKGWRHDSFTWGPIDVQDEKMADYQIVDWARYELNQKHEKPFYLACGLFRPHIPWEVPRKYFDMYPLEDIPDLVIQKDDLKDGFELSRRYLHKFVLENKQWKHAIQAYLASISFADAQVGRLLETLENSEYKDNTIVVLWSDHGMHLGEKDTWEKFTLYEEATRVPFMLKAPGITKAGSRSSQPVSLLDIYPTLVELAGYEVPEHCDGVSVIPLVLDPEAKRDHSALTSFKMFKHPGNVIGHSLRGERYRYIYYQNHNLEELYDHQIDPNEFDNIAYNKDYAEIIDSFRKELMERVDSLSMEKIMELPEGYIIKDGKVENTKFTTIEDLPLRLKK